MWNHSFAVDLMMMLLILIFLIVVFLTFFRRRNRRSVIEEEDLVEKFEQLTDLIDKRTLMELGKLKLADLPTKKTQTELFNALSKLKNSTEGFSSSINNVMDLLNKSTGGKSDSLKIKKLPAKDDDEDEPDMAEDDAVENPDEDDQVESDDEETNEVEGFIDAGVHDYMLV